MIKFTTKDLDKINKVMKKKKKSRVEIMGSFELDGKTVLGAIEYR